MLLAGRRRNVPRPPEGFRDGGQPNPRPAEPAVAASPHDVRRFIVRFATAAAVLLGLYWFPDDPRGFIGTLFRLYLTAYAHVAGGAIRIFDAAVHVEGTRILGQTASSSR